MTAKEKKAELLHLVILLEEKAANIRKGMVVTDELFTQAASIGVEAANSNVLARLNGGGPGPKAVPLSEKQKLAITAQNVGKQVQADFGMLSPIVQRIEGVLSEEVTG